MHSALDVGLDKAKITGRWLKAAMRAMIAAVNCAADARNADECRGPEDFNRLGQGGPPAHGRGHRGVLWWASRGADPLTTRPCESTNQQRCARLSFRQAGMDRRGDKQIGDAGARFAGTQEEKFLVR